MGLPFPQLVCVPSPALNRRVAKYCKLKSQPPAQSPYSNAEPKLHQPVQILDILVPDRSSHYNAQHMAIYHIASTYLRHVEDAPLLPGPSTSAARFPTPCFCYAVLQLARLARPISLSSTQFLRKLLQVLGRFNVDDTPDLARIAHEFFGARV